MSYIVPGDKPTSCMFCPYNIVDMKHRMTVCKFIPDSYKYDVDSKQYAHCPLTEIPTPHGRLGDLDKLTTEFIDSDLDHLQRDDWREVIQIVEDAPTVIEAED